MNSKKGQITIFIIIGVITVMALSFVYLNKNFVNKNTEIEKSAQLKFNIEPLKNYIESCVKSIGEDAVLWVSAHGGYFEMPAISTKNLSIDVPYYFYMNNNLMPSKEKLEYELSKYMNSKLSHCFDNLNDFGNINIKSAQENIFTKTLITPNSVLFNVYIPITIRSGNSEATITSFSSSIKNIRLYGIFNITQEIINRQVSEPNFIPVSFISNLTDENNLSIDLKVLNNDTILFTIADNENWIKKYPLLYIFANKYERNTCKNLPSEEDDFSMKFVFDCIDTELKRINYSVKITDIPDLSAKINETFYYDVNASGSSLIFTDYSELFDINNLTGEINFTPNKEEIGEYLITIKVKDKINNSDFSIFRINITE